MYCQVIIDIVHENVAHTFTYMVPEGMELKPGQRVAVPFGPREKEGVVLSLSEETDVPAGKLKAVIRPLEDYPAILPPLLQLADEMAEHAHCPLAETLRLMLPAQMRGGRVNIRTEPTVRLLIPPEAVDAAIAAQKRSEKRKTILEILRNGESRSLKEIAIRVKDPRESVRKLAEEGLVVLEDEEILRVPVSYETIEDNKILTPAQEEVLDEILPTLQGKPGRFLLHGVTGSGKTEVFITAVRKVLELGKTAIILVPEIALTPQMVSWFRARFGPVAAVLHSRLSPGERYDEWRRIRRGDAKVVIGARSAVFAPVSDLGLIVVDEEHESTYQSDHNPRYDARDVAMSRCEREGATLLLASATPSILSFAKARRGDYMLLEMPERVAGRPLPEVQVVDMRRELESGNRSVFSRAMQQALTDCIRDGHQAMLLMNHRGYHSFVSCRTCGYAVKCDSCDVAMTYHMNENDGKLHCHYCGAVREVPTVCPQCGGKHIRYFGAGTQKIEEEVRKLLPGVTTARMDIDTTGGKDGHRLILDEFRSGRARILIGTQMIAKGLDFPRVTLVGVMAADMTLNLPDYRSRERTFQLLTQVAGRAGRGNEPGQVIIQTYKPDDPVIRMAAQQDYRQFFEAEFDRRRTGLYPPFTVMARLLAESENAEEAEQTANDLLNRTQILLEEHPLWKKKTLLIRLDQPSVKVLRGKTRWHVLMKLLVSPATEEFSAALTELAREDHGSTEVHFEYNPTTMM